MNKALAVLLAAFLCVGCTAVEAGTTTGNVVDGVVDTFFDWGGNVLLSVAGQDTQEVKLLKARETVLRSKASAAVAAGEMVQDETITELKAIYTKMEKLGNEMVTTAALDAATSGSLSTTGTAGGLGGVALLALLYRRRRELAVLLRGPRPSGSGTGIMPSGSGTTKPLI